MAIRDDEPPYAPRRAPSARRDPADRHRQVMARRGMAAVIGLIVRDPGRDRRQGLPRCPQDAQLRELQRRPQLAGGADRPALEGLLPASHNPDSSKLTFQTQLKTDAGTARSLSSRAQELSTPGELSRPRRSRARLRPPRQRAQRDRRRAGRAARPEPGDREPRRRADEAAPRERRRLRARPVGDRQRALNDQGIHEQAPPSQFLPDPQTKWLDVTTIAGILSGIGVLGRRGWWLRQRGARHRDLDGDAQRLHADAERVPPRSRRLRPTPWTSTFRTRAIRPSATSR